MKGTLAVAAPFDTTDLPLVIGGDDGTRTFNGVMDQVALWNRVLTDEEIRQVAGRVGGPEIGQQPSNQSIFAGGTARSDAATLDVTPVTGLETGRVLYLPFNETSGLTATDSSGNANSGTLVSFADNTSHWVPGQVAGSVRFDLDELNNLGSSISVADSSSLDQVTGEATVAFWMKPTGWGYEDNAGSYTRHST